MRRSVARCTPPPFFVHPCICWLYELSHRTLTMPPCKHSSCEDSRFYSFVRPPHRESEKRAGRRHAPRRRPSTRHRPAQQATAFRVHSKHPLLVYYYAFSTFSLSLVCFFGRVCVSNGRLFPRHLLHAFCICTFRSLLLVNRTRVSSCVYQKDRRCRSLCRGRRRALGGDTRSVARVKKRGTNTEEDTRKKRESTRRTKLI